MARSRNCFTPEQIKVLEENPYTLRASASGLSIPLDAKFLVLELYETGMSRKKIVEALGYLTSTLSAVMPERSTFFELTVVVY